MTKTEQLQLRVTAEQKKRIRLAAKASGLDMSSYLLSRVLPPEGEAFDQLSTRLARPRTDRRFVFAEINSLLEAMDPHSFERVMQSFRLPRLEPFLANYLAAMVETAAHRKNVKIPRWVGQVQPLQNPHWGSSLLGLRLYLLLGAPIAFRRRNIFVDTSVGGQV